MLSEKSKNGEYCNFSQLCQIQQIREILFDNLYSSGRINITYILPGKVKYQLPFQDTTNLFLNRIPKHGNTGKTYIHLQIQSQSQICKAVNQSTT